VLVSGLYMGCYRLRSSRGTYYVHIPMRLALQIGLRKVWVMMRVNSRGCDGGEMHGITLAFPATLTRVGSTFRIKLPSRYNSLAARIIDCGTVDIWLAPRTEWEKG
jgi:hypothetical protein